MSIKVRLLAVAATLIGVTLMSMHLNTEPAHVAAHHPSQWCNGVVFGHSELEASEYHYTFTNGFVSTVCMDRWAAYGEGVVDVHRSGAHYLQCNISGAGNWCGLPTVQVTFHEIYSTELGYGGKGEIWVASSYNHQPD